MKQNNRFIPQQLIAILFFMMTSFVFNLNPAEAQEAGMEKSAIRRTSQVQSDIIKHDRQPAPEDIEPLTTKLVTWDATPNGLGHFEFDTVYAFAGSAKEWATNGERKNRALFRDHAFEEWIYGGVTKNLDLFVAEGFDIRTDKENNVNEVEGLFDPTSGEEMEDETMGPAHGHGLKDLTVGALWRVYNDVPKQLSFAYVPIVQIPIGRRSNLDHLGPSQGYTTMNNILVLTKNIGRLNIDVNTGYLAPFSNLDRTENYCGTFNTSLATGYQLKRWLQPEVEVLYNQSFVKRDKGSKLVTVVFGFLVTVNQYVELGVGVTQDVLGSGADQTTSGIFRFTLYT